jgi:hypothetical protein
MLKNLLVTTFTITALASSAYAQDTSSTIRAEKNPPLKRVSIEVAPIESLVSVTPGVASGGLSAEYYVGKNWAVSAGGSYADVNLPTKYITTIEDEANEPMVKKGYGYSAGAGLRYYDYPIGDSLYGGLNIDYSEAHFDWKYGDETYATTRNAVTPTLAAGYRWVWNNGLLVRLGAGAGLPSVDSQKVEAKTNGDKAREGEKKITDTLDQKVIAKVDFGVGMMF